MTCSGLGWGLVSLISSIVACGEPLGNGRWVFSCGAAWNAERITLLSLHHCLVQFVALKIDAERTMKAEIHPEYNLIKATCSCGNVIEVGSTLAEDFHVDVCSKCHPFYTGKQKILDSGGRVERFRQRFGGRGSS